jgi:hypothetical protein
MAISNLLDFPLTCTHRVAYALVGMQHRKHVHVIAPDLWPRCKWVRVDDGRIGYMLGKGRAYDLVEAYPKAPHIQFMNCATDVDFERFVREWGPLLLFPEELERGFAVMPLRDYIARKDLLRAVAQIMRACKGREDERQSLREFLSALTNMVDEGSTREVMKEAVSFDLISLPLRSIQPIRDPIKWAEFASASEIRKVLAACVEEWFSSPSRWGFRVQAKGKAFEIKPTFELNSLWDGLRWMLFFDEWNARPPVLCRECPTIFRPDNAHARKFCSPECAHRAANRDWRRKDLKKQQVKRKPKGDSNVTHKTR